MNKARRPARGGRAGGGDQGRHAAAAPRRISRSRPSRRRGGGEDGPDARGLETCQVPARRAGRRLLGQGFGQTRRLGVYAQHIRGWTDGALAHAEAVASKTNKWFPVARRQEVADGLSKKSRELGGRPRQRREDVTLCLALTPSSTSSSLRLLDGVEVPCPSYGVLLPISKQLVRKPGSCAQLLSRTRRWTRRAPPEAKSRAAAERAMRLQFVQGIKKKGMTDFEMSMIQRAGRPVVVHTVGSAAAHTPISQASYVANAPCPAAPVSAWSSNF